MNKTKLKETYYEAAFALEVLTRANKNRLVMSTGTVLFVDRSPRMKDRTKEALFA